MPDIKIKGWSGTEFAYQAVPKIWLNAAESTEESPVLVPYTYGEAVSKTVDPDFSAGDMAVEIPEGELVTGFTITKPETLIPENIAAGVNIAGVLGSFSGGAGVLAAAGTYQPEITDRITITHGLGAVPDFILVVTNATTGYLFQYIMSQALHDISASPNYGFAWYYPGNKATITEPMIESDKNAWIGIIGGANEESFKVGGSIMQHEVGKTYTWLALAIK